MRASHIPLVVGLVFIALALFHLFTALREPSKINAESDIAKKVRLRLAVIFMIVGLGLCGFNFLSR